MRELAVMPRWAGTDLTSAHLNPHWFRMHDRPQLAFRSIWNESDSRTLRAYGTD